MKERIDRIKEVFHRHKDGHPFDAVWDYCKSGHSKLERFRRFRAAQRWAQGNRDNAHGDEREAWNARRKAYAKKKRQIARRMVSQTPDNPALGTGAWAGSESILEATTLQVEIRHGIPRTSFKRWETFGNPSSDHWMGNTTAYAIDGGIATAYWLHAEITEEFKRKGIPLDAPLADYALRYCRAPNGVQFRIQNIAATHGTGPHYHSGCRRV